MFFREFLKSVVILVRGRIISFPSEDSCDIVVESRRIRVLIVEEFEEMATIVFVNSINF